MDEFEKIVEALAAKSKQAEEAKRRNKEARNAHENLCCDAEELASDYVRDRWPDWQKDGRLPPARSIGKDLSDIALANRLDPDDQDVWRALSQTFARTVASNLKWSQQGEPAIWLGDSARYVEFFLARERARRSEASTVAEESSLALQDPLRAVLPELSPNPGASDFLAGRTFITERWHRFRAAMPKHHELVEVAQEQGRDQERFVSGAADGVCSMRQEDLIHGFDLIEHLVRHDLSEKA